MSSLIEELYTDKECDSIKNLFKEDLSVKNLIKRAIGDKIILNNDIFLTSSPLDIIYLICLNSKFAVSDDECHRVAITVYQYIESVDNNLPSIVSDRGLQFASKTLIALSFWSKAVERRWRYHGAPSPKYYRDISKQIFTSHGQADIATHHEQWEGFLGEIFV